MFQFTSNLNVNILKKKNDDNDNDSLTSSKSLGEKITNRREGAIFYIQYEIFDEKQNILETNINSPALELIYNLKKSIPTSSHGSSKHYFLLYGTWRSL